MNTYVKNYWSVYLDFLHDFKQLKYRGFSLPYLYHLPSLTRHNKAFWQALYDDKFDEQLKHHVVDQKEIQDVFQAYIQSHQKQALVKNKHGKVLVNYDTILRFPQKTFDDYFDHSKTLILRVGPDENHKAISKIPTIYLNDYKIDTLEAIIQLQYETKTLFKTYRGHHLYKDTNFQKVFMKKIVDIVHYIEQSVRLLDDISVSCIIVSSTHGYISRVLALVAMEKGIPVICMQHGIIANEFGYIPKIATIDAVYGHYETSWYQRIGVPKESLAIIGHPRFDQAFQTPTVAKLKFHNQLGLDTCRKTLLIVVRGNRNIVKWRNLIRTISEKLHLNILIKDFPGNPPHPLTKEFPFVHSTKTYRLYDILPNVDGVVSYPSTVALEAMLVNKPVFILNRKHPNNTGYYDDLDELVQTDPIKLGELVVKLFNDQKYSKYVKDKREDFLQIAYPNISLSGERLKKLMNRLIG